MIKKGLLVIFLFIVSLFFVKPVFANEETESLKKDINDALVENINVQILNSKGTTPNVSVKYEDSILEKGVHYTLSFKNNKKVGTATAIIKGIGDFTGYKEINFKIAYNIASSKVTGIANKIYTGNIIKQKITVKYGTTVLKDKKDYSVSYKNNLNAGTATMIITGKGNYIGTISKTFKITRKSITKLSFGNISNKGYTSIGIKPNIVIKDSKKQLVKDIDYTLTYINNIKVGKATVKITGKGNYKGTVTKTFKIVRTSISKVSVSAISNKEYTGKAIKPLPTLKIGSATLTLNKDYTLKYSNNIKEGTASITITGKGGVSGSKVVKFKIIKTEHPYVVSSKSKIVVGSNATLKVYDNTKPITFKSQNTSIAKVSSKGVVTGVGVGTTKIYATVGYETLSYSITVSNKDNFTGYVEIGNREYIYKNGKEQGYYETSSNLSKTLYDMDGNKKSKFGIDVSEFQGKIDWTKVKKSQVDFAIIRCGFRGYGTGKLVTDATFKYNIENAITNGIDVGVYFFTEAINEKEGIEEANYVLSLIEGYNISYPIIIDTESVGGSGRADIITKAKRTEAINGFCKTIKEAGYTTMIYASARWFTTHLDLSKLTEYEKWVAHYTGFNNITDYDKDYSIWQYTSSGKLSGISTRVDFNICFKEYIKTVDMNEEI